MSDRITLPDLGEGIETATDLDIAGAMIDYVANQVAFPELDVRQRLTVSAGYGVAELLVRGILSGYRVGELPMPLGARRHGRSKLRVARAVLAHLGLLALTVGLASTGRGRVRDGARAA